ncbi:MAG: WD40 repeat domain-containing protein [Gemmataceae bacterium]
MVFTPDDKALIAEFGDDDFRNSVKAFELPSLKEKWTITAPTPLTTAEPRVCSPDSRIVFGALHTWPQKKDAHRKWDDVTSRNVAWDTATGQELWSLSLAKGESSSAPAFSPDGRVLVGMSRQKDQTKAIFIDTTIGKVTHSTPLPNFRWADPAFSPDGRWVAILTREIPKGIRNGTPPDEAPQPRVHLIETATGVVREVIVLPHAYTNHVAFSPDGKTLATDGYGRVLLWDMTTPPGELKSNVVP